MDRTWSTDTYPVDQQLAYWADVVCQAFTPLAPTRAREHIDRSRTPVGLEGWVRSTRLGETNAAEIASCTQLLRHGPREVRQSPSEEVFVNLQLAGSCKGEQGDERLVIGPGQIGIYDTTAPYTLEFEEARDGQAWRVLSFRVPRTKLARIMPADSRIGGRGIDRQRGASRVAIDMMLSIWESRGHLTPAAQLALDDSFAQVLATALGAFDGPTIEDRGARDAALRAAATRYARSRIRSGRVLAEEAAGHVGISVRKLHQVFSNDGESFGSVVRQLRLEQVARELRAQPSANVTDLAHAWGFSDSSHMIRLFREHFGCTPTEYRSRTEWVSPTPST
ncbi:AraC-like DNA-binding protein [Nocardioides aromaticivorans]|uniref:AraC-like DNA-binding protein n=1 Tax=Nocardioides aromaticivorans TaxID=200618 RepID=A0A7Y9ZHW4_9ACTN|nr:helix-turn-helix domain-containing protein [Nocardioides aromaticivorans]NYI45777.1 AraC-like DNA-binding protein [Nocardioides aromaticivorans]